MAKYLKKNCLMKLFYAFVISNCSYCATVWHFCSKSSIIKIKKMQKAALRVMFNDYTADYSQLLSMSKRSPLLIVRLRALLIEIFKCDQELDPIFMNTLFTLNNKPYDTRSGSLITQSQVKQSSTALIHLSIKATSNGMHCLQMPRILKISMYSKIT